MFTRESNDICTTVQFSLVESLCGFVRIVPTIDGKSINIEKYTPTEPESQDRYPDLGMPHSKEPHKRGDFIVKYKVQYPQSLTSRQQLEIRECLGGHSYPREPIYISSPCPLRKQQYD